MTFRESPVALLPSPAGAPGKERQPAGTKHHSHQPKMAEFRPFGMACFPLTQDLRRSTVFLAAVAKLHQVARGRLLARRALVGRFWPDGATHLDGACP